MMPDGPPLIALDFEASCLPGPGIKTYPIEVGVAFVAAGRIRSWLIRPTNEWMLAGYWDPNAERIHGISLELLRREGQDVELVRRELAEAVSGHVVVSDYAPYEEMWAQILYAGPPPFEVERYDAVLYARAFLPPIPFRDALRDAETGATARSPKTHRAGQDADWLAEVCRLMLWGGGRQGTGAGPGE